MRILFFIAIALCSYWTASAQFPRDTESKKVVYTGVVELPNMSIKALHEKAKFWMVTTLKSGDNIVELGGSNSDKIVGIGNLVLNGIDLGIEGRSQPGSTGKLNFTFIILIKENKIKYIIRNFDLIYGVTPYFYTTSLYHMEIHRPYERTDVLRANENKYFRKANEHYIDQVLRAFVNDFVSSMKRTEEEEDW